MVTWSLPEQEGYTHFVCKSSLALWISLSSLDHIRVTIILPIPRLRPNQLLWWVGFLLKFEWVTIRGRAVLITRRSPQVKIFYPAWLKDRILLFSEKCSQDLSIESSHFHKILRVNISVNGETWSWTEIQVRVKDPIEVLWVKFQSILRFLNILAVFGLIFATIWRFLFNTFCRVEVHTTSMIPFGNSVAIVSESILPTVTDLAAIATLDCWGGAAWCFWVIITLRSSAFLFWIEYLRNLWRKRPREKWQFVTWPALVALGYHGHHGLTNH